MIDVVRRAGSRRSLAVFVVALALLLGVRPQAASADSIPLAPTNSDKCARPSTTFPEVVVTGSFAYDRGCEMTGFRTDSQQAISDPKVSGAVLAKHGWQSANAKDRGALAMAWVTEVLQVNANLLDTEPDPKVFGVNGHPSFAAPAVASNADGTLTVTAWFRRSMSSMRGRVVHIRQIQVKFAADGNVLSVEELQHFNPEKI
jgi:hypothetical protein